MCSFNFMLFRAMAGTWTAPNLVETNVSIETNEYNNQLHNVQNASHEEANYTVTVDKFKIVYN